MQYKSGEIFAVIEELAKDDLLQGGTPYTGTLSLSNSNKKIKGTNIAGIDTFRGCNHGCLDCYANKMSKIARKDFGNAVPVLNFTGKIKPAKTYRIGTVGDPDHDWSHTSFVIGEMKRLGLLNYFCITKLQSIEGIDSDHIKNLQVSVDPLNKKHFFKTLRNILKIRGRIPGILIRLRTVRTENRDINRLQHTAVSFAKKYGIEILETKMRFSKKKYLEALQCYDYHRPKGNYETEGSVLAGLEMLCDPEGKGSCIGCGICDRHGAAA